MSRRVRALEDQASALAQQLAQLKQENLQLRACSEVAWRMCCISRAVLDSYVSHKRKNQTLASILATPSDQEGVLTALDRQAQQLLQQLEPIAEPQSGAKPLTTAAAAAAATASCSTAALPAASWGQDVVDPLFNWHTDPQQFCADVMSVMDWSAATMGPPEYEHAIDAVYRSLGDLLQACQQAASTSTAAAADAALRAYVTHFCSFVTWAFVLHPELVAGSMTARCDVLPEQHLKNITAAAQLSAEQLQQVALLCGAFKQLSQPYMLLQQLLQQLLLGTTEQSLTALLAGQGVPSLAAPIEQVARVLLPAAQGSTTGGGPPRLLVKEAVDAIAAAAAAAEAAAAPPSRCGSSSVPVQQQPGSGTAAMAVVSHAESCPPSDLVPTQAMPIQMTPDIAEQLSRMLGCVMKKLAWLACGLGCLLTCLLPMQQMATVWAASPPYAYDPVAWAAYVAEQVQRQQAAQQQQQQQQAPQEREPLLSARQLDLRRQGSHDLPHLEVVNGSGVGTHTSSSSGNIVAAAGSSALQADVDELCQALRKVLVTPDPEVRTQLRQAAAAHSSRCVPVGSGLPPRQPPQQQQQQQQGGDGDGSRAGAAAAGGVVDLEELLEELAGGNPTTQCTHLGPQQIANLLDDASAMLLRLQQQQQHTPQG